MVDHEIQSLIDKYHQTQELVCKAELGYQIGLKYLSSGDFDECRKYGSESLRIRKELNDLSACISSLALINRSYSNQGALHLAKDTCQTMLDIATQSQKDFDLAMANHTMGSFYVMSGQGIKAMEFQITAVHYYEKCQSEDPIQAERINTNKSMLYTNIGSFYSDLNNIDESLVWLKKALRVPTKLISYFALSQIGECYSFKNDFVLGLGYFKRAFKYAKEQNDYLYLNLIYIKMGNLYLKKQQFPEAEQILLEGYAHIQKYRTNHIFILCTMLAEICTLRKKYTLAQNYFREASEYIDMASNHERCVFNKAYYDYYTEIGNLPEAHKYLLITYKMQEDLFKEDLLKQASIMTAKFETEQKKKELAISQLQNVALLKSQKIIEQKNDDLMKTNAIKDNILGMISHDLKNYIGSTLSAHELLIIREPQLAENKYAKMINDSCNKALLLVKDILYMNKIDVNEENLALSKMELNEFVTKTLENLRLMANKKEITIGDNFYQSPIYCQINAEKFHRVLDNLIINAIKFTPKQGKIVVKTQIVDHQAYIHIIDSGIGMDAELISKLFMQYSKAGRKGTEGEESTGLGLYIVKKILNKHLATIEVFSEVGKGSEFIIKIPLIREENIL